MTVFPTIDINVLSEFETVMFSCLANGSLKYKSQKMKKRKSSNVCKKKWHMRITITQRWSTFILYTVCIVFRFTSDKNQKIPKLKIRLFKINCVV